MTEALTPKKLLLTVNPHGGLKHGEDILRLVEQVFSANSIEITIVKTEYADHAREIISTYRLDDYDGFCAIGGDGTMHEVINGLMLRRDKIDIPVGLIPGGTGSSLMHDLDCLDPVAAAARIASGRTRRIDLIEVKMKNETLYSFNVIGWGMVVNIIVLAEKMRWAGYQRYNLATLAQLIKPKLGRARLVIDDKEYSEKFIFVMGCNTQHTGKGMKIAPRAELDDGLIDLVIVRGAPRIELLKVFLNVFKGKHLSSPFVEYRQVQSFSLTPDEDSRLNVDGELTGFTPIDVKVLPKRLTIFA